ncbi:MAG: hypothetical protein E4H14_15390 [Candidatus Thorarchaeota archaeon]|nr:MAG: hypothetical protein E4H14_15390 [Candidatus Thorarchaeota archaeon]
MLGSAIPINQRTLRRVALVLIISAIIITSIVITDVSLAGIEYDVPAPVLSHDFPEIIYFYNISDGVTSNIFSIIFEFPTNHSGHHHIIPREFSLMFCFRDNATGADLSPFIMDVMDGLRNGTFSYNNHYYDRYAKYEDGWWIPSYILFVLNEKPDVDIVRCGIMFELMLVNSFGDPFDAHELNIELRMNVTYSRWWYESQISPAHQKIEYVFNLPDDGVADIQSLDF